MGKNFSADVNNNAYPRTKFSKLIEDDPQIVKVPLDSMDWGSRGSMMGRAEKATRNGKLGIRHVPNEGGKK